MAEKQPIHVVGAGLAGLTAAVSIARAGRRVVVHERASNLGGRAMSSTVTTDPAGSFTFNVGAHALYRSGPAARILQRLGIEWTGHDPTRVGPRLAFSQGSLTTLPASTFSLLRSSLLSPRDKLEFVRFLGRLASLAETAPAGRSIADVLRDEISRRRCRDLILALVRLSAYGGDPELLSADAALRQLALGMDGVLYLDEGWQTLVDRLRESAEQAGVDLRTGSRVTAVKATENRVSAIELEDRTLSTSTVVLAVGPRVAARLAPASVSLSRHAERTSPVTVAALDVALRKHGQSTPAFVLGIDRPVYVSDHGRVARLAPAGYTTVHAFRYTEAETPIPSSARAELESVLELSFPGYRAHRVHERFLPALTVHHDLPRFDRRGLAGRAPCTVSDLEGLYLAGDWVGSTGMLADAAVASASEAARRILARVDDRYAAPTLAWGLTG